MPQNLFGINALCICSHLLTLFIIYLYRAVKA